MYIHKGRPACYLPAGEPVTPRGTVCVGDPNGKRPGRRNPFLDEGRCCAQAATPEDWRRNLHHTPDCVGCLRAERAIAMWPADDAQRAA